jgi:hypothetical protein
MLKNVQELSKKFKNVKEVKKEIRNVQTKKCRLKKQKARKDYESKMKKLLEYEQALKEVKAYFEPRKKFVTEFEQEDIKNLNYEETLRAIKSIQSKKCNSQYDEDKTEYNKACEIEKMLLEHKETIKPVPEYCVRKSSINNLINHLENQEEKLDKEYVIQLLKDLNNDELNL